MSKRLNTSFSLDENEHFNYINVNVNQSTVHVPTNVYEQCNYSHLLIFPLSGCTSLQQINYRMAEKCTVKCVRDISANKLIHSVKHTKLYRFIQKQC